jgi:tRNA pseudouridine32 synthase/23S rRNA pseudouridine746 synthase
LSITIVYQDTELIIVDKPSGLLSVPGRGPHKQDCVVNRAKQLFPGLIDQPAVHRLDMYTSGLMLLAKTVNAHKHLSIQFEKRQVQKKYIALVEGIVEASGGEIRLKFRLDPDNRPYQVYDPVQGKLGITRWKQLNVQRGKTRIEFEPLTGRTHQLRLHAAHSKGLGMPIKGDRLYGSGQEGEKMCLHACQLQFHHPSSDQQMKALSEPPF